MKPLSIKNKRIADDSGKEVYLRGICIGSWLNKENFLTGFLGTEAIMTKALYQELGEERTKVFLKTYHDVFLTEEDFSYLAGLGVNVMRIAVNYHHFEDDMRPYEYYSDGFYYLDRAVEWGRKFGIYIILDLHALPGGQNFRWHSDNHSDTALLWEHRDFQLRTIALWKHIVSHYRDETVIAGYDLMNEPEAPDLAHLHDFYAELIYAIRELGDRHILFLEGNNRGNDFDGLDAFSDENLAYSSHNYNFVTLRARSYPGVCCGRYVDETTMEHMFKQRNRWMLERDLPSWCGEFSTLFDSNILDPSIQDIARLASLKDQLRIFNKYRQHWTLWTYKDIGYEGLVSSNPTCEYLKRIAPLQKIKRELSLEPFLDRKFGGIFADVHGLIQKTAQSVATHYKDYSIDYDDLIKSMGEQSICCKITNVLAPLYANVFSDMSSDEIAIMIKEAFALEHMVKRGQLEDVLRSTL
ncbi:hypothetical protein AGMMS49983_12830 [Clostridia bacterium]|nr:hypothetical protein AGMMS49983_12830 [Clostridia bacterium]